MPSDKWIEQVEQEKIISKREQVGKLIKENLNYTPDEHLGYWFEEHKRARKGIVKDGKFSKEGMSSLDRLTSLEKMLLTENLTEGKIV
jgi:hypothetical protein|tara:strand:+ start:891 stop:1154 length:264 start_codon:yes stop_codon:yes gene_type:complete